MKRFVRDIIWVGIILSCLFVYAEIRMKSQRNLYSCKYQYVQEHKDDISTLILGHSHIEGAIIPTMLDSAYNFATAGRWIYYDMHLSERFIPQMNNLNVVIFPMAYDAPWGFLSPRHAFKDFKEAIVLYEKFMDIPYDKFPYNILCHSALLNGMLHISRLQDDGVEGRDSLGFDPREFKMHCSENWRYSSLVHVEGVGSKEKSWYVEEYTMFLKNIAKVCAENKVRFVVVTTPCYNSFVSQTNDVGMRTLYDIIECIKKDYPVEYFNYLNDPEFRADSIYYDCSHLNYLGAEYFTDRIKMDIGL